MATSGDLIRVVSKAFSLPDVTVANCYRSLREAGLVPKAGRGPRSAATVTSETSAKLLIALCGSRYEKEPPEKIIENFNGLVAVSAEFKDADMPTSAECSARFRLEGLRLPFLEDLASGHTFLEALTGIIETSARGQFPFEQLGKRKFPNRVTLEISITVAPILIAQVNVMIRDQNGKYIKSEVEYKHSIEATMSHDEIMDVFDNADLTISRSFRTPTIFEIGQLLSEKHKDDIAQTAADAALIQDVTTKLENVKALLSRMGQSIKANGVSENERRNFVTHVQVLEEELKSLKSELRSSDD